MGGASLRGTQSSSGSACDAARGVRLVQCRRAPWHKCAFDAAGLAVYTTSGGRERWIALLAEPEELAAIRALQRGTFTGRPVGSPEFVARLEQELGRPLSGAKASALAPNPCSPSLNNLLRTIFSVPEVHRKSANRTLVEPQSVDVPMAEWPTIRPECALGDRIGTFLHWLGFDKSRCVA